MVLARPAWLGYLAILLCYLVPGVPVSAAGLQISPINITIPADQKTDQVWLRNDGDEVIHAQVRVFRWSQADGDDVLTPDNTLVASPPMLQIASGQQQLVRLVRVGPLLAPSDQERSYRVVVDELPVQREQHTKTALNFVFRYSIPVFIQGQAEQKAQLDWQVQQTGDEAWLLVRNGGTRNSQLASVSFTPPSGKPVQVFGGLAGYVLPGQYRRLKLPLPPSVFANGGTFTSLSGGVETHVDVAPIKSQP